MYELLGGGQPGRMFDDMLDDRLGEIYDAIEQHDEDVCHELECKVLWS